jgi:hypothetical protein
MNTQLWIYIAYLVVCVGMTIWVARTLRHNGAILLSDAFAKNGALAESVSHLLVVGFYLINIGFICLALKYGGRVQDEVDGLELLGTKVGFVMLVLGGMHFMTFGILSKHLPRGDRGTGIPPAML